MTLLALLFLCAVVAVPVFVLTLVARDLRMAWVRRRFVREMTAAGVDPTEIDRRWVAIERGEWPGG